MGNSLNNAGVFLISTLFDLYIFVLIVRLTLVYVRADYFNPISQFITRLTQHVVLPLRKVIPNYRHIELATILVIFVLELLKFLCIGLLLVGMPNLVGLAILACADMLKSILNLCFYAILLQAIMSWFQNGYNPASEILVKITQPILRPIQRVIPPIGGIDISPVFAMILFQLLIIAFVGPLFAYGQALAFT
jgi:YggT family protein